MQMDRGEKLMTILSLTLPRGYVYSVSFLPSVALGVVTSPWIIAQVPLVLNGSLISYLYQAVISRVSPL